MRLHLAPIRDSEATLGQIERYISKVFLLVCGTRRISYLMPVVIVRPST